MCATSHQWKGHEVWRNSFPWPNVQMDSVNPCCSWSPIPNCIYAFCVQLLSVSSRMCTLKNNFNSSLGFFFFGNLVSWLANWLTDGWTNSIIKLLYSVKGIFIFYFGIFQMPTTWRWLKMWVSGTMLILILSFQHIYYLAKVSVLFWI